MPTAPATSTRIVGDDHEADRLLWKHTHPDRDPDGYLSDNQRIEIAGTQLRVLHTPGHTPGAVCFHLPDLATVFTDDTLWGASWCPHKPDLSRLGWKRLPGRAPRS